MKIQQHLHILHLTDGNRGGSQRHIIDLCHGDAPDVRHFVLRIADGALSLHDAARARVLVTAPAPAPAGLMATLRRVIDELGIDVVHAHALPVLLAAAEAPGRPLAGVPLVVTLHDLGCIDAQLFTAPSPQLRTDPRWIARCAPVLREAAAVIVPSDFLAGLVEEWYPGVHPVVIANGIGAAAATMLPSLAPGPSWPRNARAFAVVGALGPHKGSDTLLRVANALTSPGIVGVVIGYTEAQLTSGWVVPGRLYVHGRYVPDELPGLLAGYRARIAYFPNVIPESFSYALSEVWQAGMPALVPAIGALGDRVRATGAGWLLDDPLDAPAAAAAIERLLAPAGVEALATARERLATPGAVPDVGAMRTGVERVYRDHGAASAVDADAGWTRLRSLLRAQILSGIDDCALDAEWPALVREERTLRGWNEKLAGDVALLGESNAELERSLNAQRARNFELENGAVALRARNVQIEADTLALSRRNVQLEGDIVALTQRHIELDTDIVALKERNTLVEADLFALKQRNTHVERDAVALQAELAGTHERLGRIELELAGQRERAARFERALAIFPLAFQNWLLRHVR